MEELKLQNDSLPSCTTHPNSPIQYYCSVDGCPRSLLCRDCIKSHIHPYLTQDTFIHDLNSALSDETFISCQKKLSSSISSSDHNNAIAAFIESFFAKLQAEILKNIEEAKNSALNTVKNYSENENFPIDALKIELSGLREEYLASEQNSRYEKMEKYIQKYIEINNKVDNAQKMKMPVPVINQEEYERFLSTFKKEIQAFSSALLDPSSLVPQIDEKYLQKRAMLQERIPGLIDHGDKVIVNWIGQKLTPQNVEDLHTFLKMSPDVVTLKLCFGKYYMWGPKGSNITDSDLENYIVEAVLSMKKLERLKLNLTKTRITNKCLETLKKLIKLTHLRKLFISVYDTSIKLPESSELSKFLDSNLTKTKVIIRDKEGNHVTN